MHACAECRRLIRETEGVCPFCRARASAGPARIGAVTIAVAIAASVATTACYGGPSKHDRQYTAPPPEPAPSGSVAPAPEK